MLDYLRAECYKMLRRSYLWMALLITGGLELVLVLLWAWLNGDTVNMTASTGFTMVLYLLSLGYYATALTSDMPAFCCPLEPVPCCWAGTPCCVPSCSPETALPWRP